MIVKKVKSSKVKNKSASIRDLANYVREPEKQNPDEKVLYSSGRGFIGDSHAAQREEMVALASEAVRSKNPVNHYIMSWREGEHPSPAHVEKAVDIFIEELGLTGHQVIYALHKDTDNLHLHMVVNRVHPDTLKCIEINKGFDIEAAHKAIARIEHAQGWQREQNGRYQVRESGELGREHTDRNKVRQPDQRKRDMEHRTGEKSAERIAIEDGAPVIKSARTWEQLHRELAGKGMRYEKTGSGATILVGEIRIKASSADREATLSKLQKRLGEYVPAPELQAIALRQPEPVQRDISGWPQYIAGRKAHYAEKNAAKLALDTRTGREQTQLARQQKTQREELLQGRWKGKGELLNALRSVVAAEQSGQTLALKDRHQTEREQHRQRFRPYPDFEQWQRLRDRPDLAEQWRYRASAIQRIEGARYVAPLPRDIRAYRAEIRGPEVHYFAKEVTQPEAVASFVDKGTHVDVLNCNRDTILAGMQLSAQKWGHLEITGHDEYKAVCVELAVEHGFTITNPELQAGIQAEQQRLQQERVLQKTPVAQRPDLAPHEFTRAPRGPVEAYQWHRRDVLERQQGNAIDLSRVDSMVAVRMRVTGYDEATIASTIRQCAPRAHTNETDRDWNGYGQRTARFAYSAAGARQVSSLEKYREQWQRVVGQQPESKKRQQSKEHEGPSWGR